MTKSLLVGASGQLGRQILRVAGERRFLVSARKAGDPGEVELDLARIETKADAERMLEGHDLDAVFCIAGMTNVDGCEDVPEQAFRTNCRGPQRLAELADERGIPFLYFSTEYVFDGEDGPYDEGSMARPLSVYGRSKWEGELAVQAACARALILRTTVVYGQDSGQKNYLYSVVRSLGMGQAMRVPEDQISTPTYNRDLAATTMALMERGATGVFHVCGPELMGRLEFARSVAKHLGLDASLLQGVPTSALGQKAPRPLAAGMKIDKLRREHPDLAMRTLAEGLADCRLELDELLASGYLKATS